LELLHRRRTAVGVESNLIGIDLEGVDWDGGTIATHVFSVVASAGIHHATGSAAARACATIRTGSAATSTELLRSVPGSSIARTIGQAAIAAGRVCIGRAVIGSVGTVRRSTVDGPTAGTIYAGGRLIRAIATAARR
jgi:hypothetical protein